MMLQLCRVVHAMSDCANKKTNFVATFLDMETAFDRVWYEGLLYKLTTVDLLTVQVDRPHN